MFLWSRNTFQLSKIPFLSKVMTIFQKIVIFFNGSKLNFFQKKLIFLARNRIFFRIFVNVCKITSRIRIRNKKISFFNILTSNISFFLKFFIYGLRLTLITLVQKILVKFLILK